MQIIPASNNNDQIFTTTLNGQVVRIRLTWQDEGESWFFTLLTATSEIIISNVRIKSGFPLINFKLLDFEGDFVAIRLDVNSERPLRNAWGNTHSLVYLTPDETSEALNAVISESS